MMAGATLLWGGLAVVAGTGLFLMKYEVQTEERHLRHVQKDILQTEQGIHVLKAEWSYLNDPMRLREQAERHLGLRPMRASQITTIRAIPMLGEPAAVPVVQHPAAKTSSGTHPPLGSAMQSKQMVKPGEKSGAKPPAKMPLKPSAPGHSMVAQKARAVADPEVASTRMRP